VIVKAKAGSTEYTEEHEEPRRDEEHGKGKDQAKAENRATDEHG
jgi:hypothetical protein